MSKCEKCGKDTKFRRICKSNETEDVKEIVEFIKRSDKEDKGQGVIPSAIDKDCREWIKNYQVWEISKKVFLYPKNWLEPEGRNDRSAFFKELESCLVQNGITEWKYWTNIHQDT
jgi:ABC toxin N-terminal region